MREGTHSKAPLQWARKLMYLANSWSIVLKPSYLPGMSNLEADNLSWGKLVQEGSLWSHAKCFIVGEGHWWTCLPTKRTLFSPGISPSPQMTSRPYPWMPYTLIGAFTSQSSGKVNKSQGISILVTSHCQEALRRGQLMAKSICQPGMLLCLTQNLIVKKEHFGGYVTHDPNLMDGTWVGRIHYVICPSLLDAKLCIGMEGLDSLVWDSWIGSTSSNRGFCDPLLVASFPGERVSCSNFGGS